MHDGESYQKQQQNKALTLEKIKRGALFFCVFLVSS